MGATAVFGALAVVGGALNAKESHDQANAAKKLGKFQAAALEKNAQFADEQAADAIRIGSYEASLRALQGEQDLGSARAQIGASGIDLNVGSASRIQTDLQYLTALDKATIRNNAQREALGFTEEARDLRTQAEFARRGGNAAARGYRAQTASTLIGTASDVYGFHRTQRGRAQQRVS